MVVKLLTKDEYLATFAEPMRQLQEDEIDKPVDIGEYVSEVIGAFDQRVTHDQLQINDVIMNGNRTFYHVLIEFGRRNEFLVVVVDCNKVDVYGHYLLNLNREYGLT